MANGISPPDPYVLSDSWTGISFKQTAGLTPRLTPINPAKKTAVCIVTGQSLLSNVVPSLRPPTNAGVIDQLNIYDGALYNILGPLLGSTLSSNGGNVATWVADGLISGGFDRVILVCTNVGSTTIAQWATGNMSDRFPVAMRRLAARGITPGMTGVTFLNILAQGNEDLSQGTSGAAYSASLATYIANTRAVMTSGKVFICLDSGAGQTSNVIRTAQASAVNGTTVFSGGDIDSSTIDTLDGVHPSDAGAPTMGAIINAAIHASGAPF